MRADLHVHSDASDGSLSPAALRARAASCGVELLALTDHDTLAGFRRLRDSQAPGPRILSGIELSSVWRGIGIHVLGLGVAPEHPAIRFAEAYQQQVRNRRGELIAQRLAKLGLGDDLLDEALAYAGAAQLGRPHFARCLVERGIVADFSQAFDRYLGAGRVGDVKALWPQLDTVIAWITRAGGVALLAHPLKYRLTRTRLRALLGEFRSAGGRGLEVISGSQTRDQTAHLARLAVQHRLLASAGSDFHVPDLPWRELGCSGRLPAEVEPVWQLWPEAGRSDERRGAWLGSH